MKEIKLFFERTYPYLIAAILCFVIKKIDFVFVDNKNMDDLIDGIVMMESIVIGLIGAIIPVVLSMKNESKFVKYVFENDKKGLFRKYLTSTIGVGLLSMAFSLSLYIREEYEDKILYYMFFIWLFFIILFFVLTYRSMKYMIIIIFTPDTDTETASNDMKIEEGVRKELRERHSTK